MYFYFFFFLLQTTLFIIILAVDSSDFNWQCYFTFIIERRLLVLWLWVVISSHDFEDSILQSFGFHICHWEIYCLTLYYTSVFFFLMASKSFCFWEFFSFLIVSPDFYLFFILFRMHCDFCRYKFIPLTSVVENSKLNSSLSTAFPLFSLLWPHLDEY